METHSERSFIFSVEKKFREDNIQFSSQNLFPFPETAYDTQTVCKIVGCLHITIVSWHRG